MRLAIACESHERHALFPRTKKGMNAYEKKYGHRIRINAKLTSWNARYKYNGSNIVQINKKNKRSANSLVHDKQDLTAFPPKFFVGRQNYMIMKNQAKYKYVLYLDGNVGASRLGTLLKYGFVILVPRSCLWTPQPYVFQFLKSGVNCLFIREDLGDLDFALAFCESNQTLCEEISKNAVATWKKHLTQKSVYSHFRALLDRPSMFYVQPNFQQHSKNEKTTVSDHYNSNTLGKNQSFTERNNNISIIRRENNSWKRSLITNGIRDIVEQNENLQRVFILDVACGRGGDLFKYSHCAKQHFPIQFYLIGIDIAQVRINAANERIQKSNDVASNMHTYFTCANMIDCSLSKTLLPSFKKSFDCISIMFALHYACKDKQSFLGLLNNIDYLLSSNPHARVIGTVIDAHTLYERVIVTSINKGKDTWSNSVCTIQWDNNAIDVQRIKSLIHDDHPNSFPVVPYTFSLVGALERCEEYIVFPKIVASLLKERNMKITFEKKLLDTEKHKATDEDEYDVLNLYCSFEIQRVSYDGQFFSW